MPYLRLKQTKIRKIEEIYTPKGAQVEIKCFEFPLHVLTKPRSIREALSSVNSLVASDKTNGCQSDTSDCRTNSNTSRSFSRE